MNQRIVRGALALLTGALLTGCTLGPSEPEDDTSGPAVADGSRALAVSGRVVDGPVSNATVKVFADSSMALPLGGVSDETDVTGRFEFTVPGASLAGLSFVFLKSKGGTDVDTLDAAPELAAAASAVGNGRVTLTLASTLAIRTLNADRGATVEQSYAQVRGLFGLPASFDLNPFDVPSSSELATVNQTIIGVGLATHTELFTTRERTAAALEDLASALARGTGDVATLASARAALFGGHGGVSVRTPPEITLGAITVGGQRFELGTLGVRVASDSYREVSVTGVSNVVGTALPDISLNLPDGGDAGARTTFTGALELQVKAASPDKRLLNLRLEGVSITSAGTTGAPLIVISNTATLTASGTDGAGRVVASLTITGVPGTAPDLVTVTPETGGKRLTLHPPAILRELTKLLSGAGTDHPTSLLDAAVTADLAVTVRGFPSRTAGGRVRRILIAGLSRS